MHFTLRQLQVFTTIAKHQNVSRAAEALAMSQSACSGALKDLERQYDAQLFERIGKKLSLNSLGARLRPQAEALLDRATELEREFISHKEAAHVKLGATLTIGNYLAVPLIQQFMAQYQGSATLQVANTQHIASKLLSFELDIGLIEGEINHPDLHIIPWQHDELCCFSSPNHALAHKKNITDNDLIHAQWILRESGSGTRQTFERAMQGLLPNLNILLELQHTEAIKRAVKGGLGIACLSKISLEEAFHHKTLVPLNVKHRNFSRRLYVVVHKHKYQSMGIKQWLEMCGVG
ncbi:LysR substrate-binding domain-containing protein [Marinagarivorans algicola]|uniref:LysR substrate-binding domain-containing protein n=1 Tax=Marinagarivorans algicola TaxID=1513270 RepID=UPI0006B5B311|nr:LysR substrate-binding domain-containing protein [Marinagarivorans algicola]